MPALKQLPTANRGAISLRTRLLAHLSIARLDHSIKNLFALPGILVPLSVVPGMLSTKLLHNVLLGLVSMTLIASSNYVLNEMLDAPYDRLHPTKSTRPAAQGLIDFRVGYAQWLGMMIAGLALANLVSRAVVILCLVFWVMGCLYNIPPIRTKDLPYLDVLSESMNNPLRLLLGWYMVTATLIPPVSLLVAYWMIGAYFMALKRSSEYRELGSSFLAGAYRRSFLFYSQQSLLVSVVFYASTAMLFFGAFVMRYRLELICSFPFLAVCMAIYFHLSFEEGSAVQNPEKLYREPALMSAIAAYIAISVLLLWVDLPFLNRLFLPTLPAH